MFKWNRSNTSTNQTVINSEEYDKCLRRMSELDTGIKTVKSEIELLRTDLANLRGKFNAKLTRIKEEEAKEETKDIYTTNEIPFG